MTHPTRPDREALIGLLLRYNGIPNAGEGDPYYEDAANQVDKFLAALPQAPAPAPSPDLLEAARAVCQRIVDWGNMVDDKPMTLDRMARFIDGLCSAAEAALASTPPPEAAPAHGKAGA